METVELLKKAWEAVVSSGVPTAVQGVALKVAVEDIRSTDAGGRTSTRISGSQATPKKPASGKRKSGGGKPSGTSGILKDVGDTDDFFERVSCETGVDELSLRDVFHIENGELELKVASRELGDSNKASTITVTVLLSGSVFAGTDHRRLPVKEVHDVCKTKRCHAGSNAATWVKAAPCFTTIGAGPTADVTPRSGWQDEFARAVKKVLGKSDDEG